MKINIELDCSPEEFKELFIPGDKQTEFTTEFYNAMQKSFVKQYLDMGKNFMNQFEEKTKWGFGIREILCGGEGGIRTPGTHDVQQISSLSP